MTLPIETASLRAATGTYPAIPTLYGPGEGPMVSDPYNENSPLLHLGDAPQYWAPTERHTGDIAAGNFLGYVYYTPTQIQASLNPPPIHPLERRTATVQRRKS
jgi:hypothetical protein